MAVQYSYGTGQVLAWYPCRVIVNSLNLENIMMAEATSTSNVGSGRFTVKVSDPNGLISDTMDVGASVQIYLSQEPVANQPFAGFLESKEFKQGEGHTLTLTGRENAARLFNQILTAAVTYTGADAADMLKGIMSYQTDFTVNNVPASFSLTGTITFNKGDTLMSCIKKICDTFNLVWWIDVTGDMHAQLASALVYSANTLVAGDTLKPGTTVTQNKELLCNTVIVDAASGVTYTKTDATSESQYGKHTWQITVEGLAAAADCQKLAETYIGKYKDPINQYETDGKFLDDVFPNYFISVTDAVVSMSGYYQIYEITHKWESGALNTKLKLGTRLDDEFIQMGKMFDRLRVVDRKAWTGS